MHQRRRQQREGFHWPNALALACALLFQIGLLFGLSRFMAVDANVTQTSMPASSSDVLQLQWIVRPLPPAAPPLAPLLPPPPGHRVVRQKPVAASPPPALPSPQAIRTTSPLLFNKDGSIILSLPARSGAVDYRGRTGTPEAIMVPVTAPGFPAVRHEVVHLPESSGVSISNGTSGGGSETTITYRYANGWRRHCTANAANVLLGLGAVCLGEPPHPVSPKSGDLRLDLPPPSLFGSNRSSGH